MHKGQHINMARLKTEKDHLRAMHPLSAHYPVPPGEDVIILKQRIKQLEEERRKNFK